MGYAKIVQYGDVIEYYQYEKNRPNYKKPYISEQAKKRTRNIRLHAKKTKTYSRKKSSILRSKQSFYRLCHHNNVLASTIHFFTLTFAYDLTYKTASRNVRRFMEKVKAHAGFESVSYISVPELTKKGRFHFHLLVYNLPAQKASFERETRNFQRLFERGYVDIVLATYTSTGIAGYMAKYMAKALEDEKNETTRGYNCSRNIEKIYSTGSNTLSEYHDILIPDTVDSVEQRQYDVPYLGKCLYSRIIKKTI